MTFTRRASAALLVGCLLLSGCARHAPEAVPARPASSLPAGSPAGSSAGSSTGSSAVSSTGDVEQLLDEVDKQLHADDQPATDQD